MAQKNATATHRVKFTLALNTSSEHAWRALTESIDAWWPADFRAGPPGSRMQLTANLGGLLLEASESGDGIVWYQVIARETAKTLCLAGFIAPPFGGPATSLLRLSLIATSPKQCAFEVDDNLLGEADAKAVESGWRAIFGQFAKHVHALA
jgi:hypothetical protein